MFVFRNRPRVAPLPPQLNFSICCSISAHNTRAFLLLREAAAARDVDAAVRTWRPAKVYDGVDDDPALFHPSTHGLIRQR